MELVLIWLLFGVASAVIATNRGGGGCAWFALGVLFGPFAFAFAFTVGKKCSRCATRVGQDARVCPHCGERFEGSGLAESAAHETEAKQCPFCAEMILAKAKKCRYCGEFIADDVAADQTISEEIKRLAEEERVVAAEPLTYATPDNGVGKQVGAVILLLYFLVQAFAVDSATVWNRHAPVLRWMLWIASIACCGVSIVLWRIGARQTRQADKISEANREAAAAREIRLAAIRNQIETLR
jgi:RNA polymerase subunit RPABC4/transcription elongation factor Spt4